MSTSSGHGWGFCDAKARLPDILFQRIVTCYISTVYYAGVAMVGKSFSKESGIISVDAWKAAFNEEDLLDAFRYFFCDALPKNYAQLVKDEVRKHPLHNVAPATIPLSTVAAKDQWATSAGKFLELEGEIEEWAAANVSKLPNAVPNFDINRMFDEMEEGDEEENEDY